MDEKDTGRGRAARVPVNAAATDTVQGIGAGRAPTAAPKPIQPRQRKLEMRVNPVARGDVAAALGQQTKSGRKVRHTKKALGED